MVQVLPDRCRANMAHVRQSRPGSGLGCKVQRFKLFPLLLEVGSLGRCGGALMRGAEGQRRPPSSSSLLSLQVLEGP